MKCEICGKEINLFPITVQLDAENGDKRVLNVPSHQCPDNHAIIIPKEIMERAKKYATIDPGTIVDYQKHGVRAAQ